MVISKILTYLDDKAATVGTARRPQCRAPPATGLFDWHGALFPTGRSGMREIIVGNWRDDSEGPMQVVSGPIGRERIRARIGGCCFDGTAVLLGNLAQVVEPLLLVTFALRG